MARWEDDRWTQPERRREDAGRRGPVERGRWARDDDRDDAPWQGGGRGEGRPDPERWGEGWSGGRRDAERGGDYREGDYTTYGSGAHFGTRGEFLGDWSRRELRGGDRAWHDRDERGGDEPRRRYERRSDEARGPGVAPDSGRRGLEWRPEGREDGDRPRHEFDDRAPLDRLGGRFRGTWRPPAGRGPKGYRRSDERIHEELCERIARSGIDAGEVEVKVERGEVTLSGEVATRYDKRMLEDLAEEVFGVEDVQNHLRLARPGDAQRPTVDDEQLDGDRGDPDARH